MHHSVEAVIAHTNAHVMNPVIFREYDIRGVVGVDLFVEATYELGFAIASYFKKYSILHHPIIVGMDVRTHSPALHKELVRALLDSGYDVIDLGVCTTPMLYFATHKIACAGGIMITASHNPKEYNGFKIVLSKDAIWGDQVREVKELYYAHTRATATHTGVHTLHDISDVYAEWLLTQFPALHDMQLPVAFDCANGATSVIIHKIAKLFGWLHVHILYGEPDGMFPNHPADPIEMHNMQHLWQQMRTHNIPLGIGFDGDGDRMDALDEQGNLIPGDKLLALFACFIAQQKCEPISMVCDITASAGVMQYAERYNVRTTIAPCGIGNIKQQMRVHNAPIGGELSCHFIFDDERGLGFDDGIYAALRLLEIMVTTGLSLHQLCADFPVIVSSPQYRVPCPEESKKKLVARVYDAFVGRPDVMLVTIDGVRVIFPYGWGLVRASNTLPALVFRFEASDNAQLAQIKKMFAGILSEPLGADLYGLLAVKEK